jgi:four helix bundle protein
VSFQDLKVWQMAHKAVLQIYRLTESFPGKESFRLTDNLLRAAISVPNNIAEGRGRYSNNDFIKFLIIARGSK